MRLVTGIVCAVLVAALAVTSVVVDTHRPYLGTRPENTWLLMISNIAVFSADLAKLESDIVYHGGVYAGFNPDEYNVFRPYNPAVLLAHDDHADHDDGHQHHDHGTTNAAAFHMHIRDEAEVLPYMAIAAKLNPHDDDNWANAAYMLSRTRRTNEALAVLMQGIQRNPSNVSLRLSYVERLYRMGDIASYAHVTNLLVSIRPHATDPFDLRRLMDYLGMCYIKLGCTNEFARLKEDWQTQFPDRHMPDLWIEKVSY